LDSLDRTTQSCSSFKYIARLSCLAHVWRNLQRDFLFTFASTQSPILKLHASARTHSTMTMSPTTPFIAFNPPLSLQRQALILQTLREARPKSVFDAGCGSGSLLACLCRCDEALPVELVAGIDIHFPAVRHASQVIQTSADDQQADGRWSPLDITLLHGNLVRRSV
jgi:2-polyprenyl-3-methyl-5-hydroxy-6-metoxy-1,4-benzoquinol methylase